MTKKDRPFETEAAMCAAFVAALPAGWTSYAETGGWDLLLVRGVDGFQIGIQAKLRLGVEVINQATEDRYRVVSAGPDCRAILVPWCDAGYFDHICAYIGITILRMVAPEYAIRAWGRQQRFCPHLPLGLGGLESEWYELVPAKRHKLPEYVPDVAAGTPSPIRLTAWKIAAIKLAVTLEHYGNISRADFKHVGIDYRRWIAPGVQWLTVDDAGYIRGPRMPDFVGQHPMVYEQIKSEKDRWMRKRLVL